jgi:hypothetical protein
MELETLKNTTKKYKNKCSGKGCSDEGKFIVKVRFVNKTGLFCKSCAQDLSQKGLGDVRW